MQIDKDLVAASATPLVLAILAEGESYGYAILKRVRELSDGRARVDRRDALPAAPSPRSARVRDDGVANAAGRAAPQVLRDHRRRAERHSRSSNGSG